MQWLSLQWLLLVLRIPLGRAQGGRFHCETQTCALWDDWVPLALDNSTRLCREAQDIIHQQLVAETPIKCRATWPWTDCRRQYCDAFDRALQRVLHFGGPGFHGGEECRPLLNFNRSLCETHYRDADAFCNCFCPGLNLLESQFTCEDELLRFLLLGRRGGTLLQNYSVRPFCEPFLCQWFEKIGDPSPPYPIEGVPAACPKLDLPYRVKQCKRIFTRHPYNPCPWETPTELDDILRCSDQTEHLIDSRQVDSWAVCEEHEDRWQCPQNYPVMCAGRHCIGNSDHCCETEVTRCRQGVARQCSPALDILLPEWVGNLTPEEAAARVTTTAGPEQPDSNAEEDEVEGTPFIVWINPHLPVIYAVVGGIGFIFAVSVCLYLCLRHSKTLRKAVLGVPRILNKFQTDPVSVIRPSVDALPKGWEKELPPKARPWQEVEAERLDKVASTALRAAVRAAEELGLNYVGADHNPRAFEEAGTLRQAIREARVRGVEDQDGNANLIARGERWLQTLEAEHALFKGMEAARPALKVVGKRMTSPPLPGIPWQATKVGRLAEGEAQRAAWHQVEGLTELLKEARAAGASEGLTDRAAELLAQIVARTGELPADRCVLDPDGNGVKLLPRGTQRAIWLQTGESYMYNTDGNGAGSLGETIPPREQLGGVSVDECRPVCAEWAKRHSCKAGRRCPWRHAVPQPGDSIRECIMYEDN